MYEDIVKNFTLDDKGYFVLELNHKYKKKKIPFQFEFKRYQKSLESFEQRLESKRIESKHVRMLIDTIDENHEKIMEFIENCQETEEEGTLTSEAQVILDVLNNENLVQELFLDQYNTPYAAIKVDDHVETVSMRTKASTQIKNWICYRLYKAPGLVPRDESLNSALNVLRARAKYEGKVRELHLRVGPGNEPNEILYDLTNNSWEFVRITPKGWSIERYTDTTPTFKRYKNQLAQVHPSKEYSPDIFSQFMNLLNIRNENAKLLLKVYVILLVVYNIQKPILATHGEQGSAKSTLHEYIKQVIDPSAAITLGFPRDVNELIQKLDHNYIAYFDNISRIPDWISDQFCRAVTGSGFSKRQLYTDDDDIIYSFKRALGFNGINLAASKADLLDRCLIILLERIKEDKRRPLQDIANIKGMNQELEKIRPQLLGYIFDMVARLLTVISTEGITKPKELPRMADFALRGEIVSRCLGYDQNVFLNAFNENIRLQSDELIESNPLAMTVSQLVQWNPKFKGTATKLLEELNAKAGELGIQQDKFWPKGPGALSRKLNLIRTPLRRVGVDIEFYEHTGEEGKSRGIEIRKISSRASESSENPTQTRIDTVISGNISGNSPDNNTLSSEGTSHSERYFRR